MNDYKKDQSGWLPTSAKELKEKGWKSVDVILVSGDAYIDHPSFGPAVMGRTMQALGLKVAILPQPNWQDDLRDFKKLGRPNLFFGVTAGNMDSMINHYTAGKRKRSNDAYSPNDTPGLRPDYPSIVYSSILKKLYPDTPIVLGGIEASLRRVTHYDYWKNKLNPSILVESEADLLIYGMGERPITELVTRLQSGESFQNLTDIRQTVILQKQNINDEKAKESITLFSHETCLNDKLSFARNFKHIEEQSNKLEAKIIVQEVNNRYLIVNPPFPPLTQKELDKIYDLPFTRLPHPRYQGKTFSAYEMIKHSVNIHRGCFGGCAFCTISAHQGKFISSRSEKSIIKEVDKIKKLPDFKGYISDLGGPSANMYGMRGFNLEMCKKCKRPSCIHPEICNNLNIDHSALTKLYNKVSNQQNIKKVFIGSGIRYDLPLAITKSDKINEKNRYYLENTIANHVSGRLKVAPEHVSDSVLNIMRKPTFLLFKELTEIFEEINKKKGLKQQLIPYFISSHPGSTRKDMANLMLETQQLNFRLEQVQDFTPSPMTLATVIYYSGYHPYTEKEIYTAKSPKEKKDQNKFFFWYKKEYRKQIEVDLQKMGLKKPPQNQKK